MIKDGISVTIPELDEASYKIREFKLFEEVGGKIANGEISCTYNINKATIDLYTLTISIQDGSGYKCDFNAYIYDLIYKNGSMDIKFICSKPEFVRNNIVKSYSSVLQAINGNWDGEFDYNGSDIECEIHQRAESGYQLVNKLLKGLQYHSIYGFRCNSIFVREINSNFDLELDDSAFVPQLTDVHISKSKVKDLQLVTEDIGLSTTVTYSRNYRQCRSEYKDLISNYFINESFLKISGTTNVVINYSKFFPKLLTGSIIKFKLENLEYDKFIVYSKVMDLKTEGPVNFQIKLIGYDWQGT